jgi:hypothetical protein
MRVASPTEPIQNAERRVKGRSGGSAERSRYELAFDDPGRKPSVGIARRAFRACVACGLLGYRSVTASVPRGNYF